LRGATAIVAIVQERPFVAILGSVDDAVAAVGSVDAARERSRVCWSNSSEAVFAVSTW
jgi:hypothetical protein